MILPTSKNGRGTKTSNRHLDPMTRVCNNSRILGVNRTSPALLDKGADECFGYHMPQKLHCCRSSSCGFIHTCMKKKYLVFRSDRSRRGVTATRIILFYFCEQYISGTTSKYRAVVAVRLWWENKLLRAKKTHRCTWQADVCPCEPPLPLT